MVMHMDEISRLDAMRAIETLRSGVPSVHAVRALGCAQTAIEARFQQQLQVWIEASSRPAWQRQ